MAPRPKKGRRRGRGKTIVDIGCVTARWNVDRGWRPFDEVERKVNMGRVMDRADTYSVTWW